MPIKHPAIIDSFTGPYRFLSNFYSSPVDFEGVTYPTVEHAYQAAKTINMDLRKKVRACNSAGEAKRLGRRLDMRPDWLRIKLDVMYTLLLQKFQNEVLAEMLRQTGDAELVEGNTWGDEFWGRCRGKGLNHLGRLLMQIRDAPQ